VTDFSKDSPCTSASFAAYESALAAGLLLFAPYALAKMLYTPSYRAGLAQRLALKVMRNSTRDASRPLLIQAVSLGEVKSVAPLARLIARDADCPIHVTTTTETGQRMARELFSSFAAVSYFPLDFRWITARVLSRAYPRAVVLFETEIWPNFIRTAHRMRIPLAIVNGRISERSFRFYRMAPRIFKSALSWITRAGMQSDLDAERALALGADPQAVAVCGNIKFDAAPEPPSPEQTEYMRTALMLPKDAPLIVGGSTHDGEEAALLKSFQRILQEHHNTRLLLAPRHPERFNEVESLIRSSGFNVIRRSRLSGAPQAPPAPGAVILLDTIGELAQVYALAAIAFVGGSLARVGGHNIIEPASLEKPVLFGPHMHHFKDIAQAFVSERAARCVSSDEDLGRQIKSLLEHPSEAQALGRAAKKVVEKHRGATGR